MAFGDDNLYGYQDPVEAAKKRQIQQRTGQSYFPAANLGLFGQDDTGIPNDPFRKMFGGGLPSPTPTPLPAPRFVGISAVNPPTDEFKLPTIPSYFQPSSIASGFQFARSTSPLSGGARSTAVGGYGSNPVTNQANLNVASAMDRSSSAYANRGPLPLAASPYGTMLDVAPRGVPLMSLAGTVNPATGKTEYQQKYGWNG